MFENFDNETSRLRVNQTLVKEFYMQIRSEHFFMLLTGQPVNKGIQDGGQNGQQENVLRLS